MPACLLANAQDLSSNKIRDTANCITGEHFGNLRVLNLDNNLIADLSGLTGLSGNGACLYRCVSLPLRVLAACTFSSMHVCLRVAKCVCLTICISASELQNTHKLTRAPVSHIPMPHPALLLLHLGRRARSLSRPAAQPQPHRVVGTGEAPPPWLRSRSLRAAGAGVVEPLGFMPCMRVFPAHRLPLRVTCLPASAVAWAALPPPTSFCRQRQLVVGVCVFRA